MASDKDKEPIVLFNLRIEYLSGLWKREIEMYAMELKASK